MMCRLLSVSTSGYYAWRHRGPSARAIKDRQLAQRIEMIHDESGASYGMPRIHPALAEEGWRVAPKRVTRLMRQLGIRGVTRRKGMCTTVSDDRRRPYPDQLERGFEADKPDQVYVADITYVPTWAGFLYLAIVMDVFSRRIVGWAMASHLGTSLVLDALEMALWQRQPQQVIHHSDQGCQYTSTAFGERCRQAGVRPSMGSAGDCYDNAMAESFFATLECELIDRRSFRNRDEARRAIFRFIEGWYNPSRRHSAIGNQSPAKFEQQYAQCSTVELSTEAG